MSRDNVVSMPVGVTVLERGWLSSNNVLLVSAERAAVIDTGYVAHASQTVALVHRALAGRSLDLIVNTHLHSDHCGGNAALQAAYPAVRTSIPPGLAEAARDWDEEALSFAPTGQSCARFRFEDVIGPGSELRLGNACWQVHAAPGHDPHSVILFEPESRTLISADALWENGFGVVFPELEGEHAFGEVAATLDLIERLRPEVVIPGHGGTFGGSDRVGAALERARGRLGAMTKDPARHAAHGAKVLIKFKVLEWQCVDLEVFTEWACSTRHLCGVHRRFFADLPMRAWLAGLLTELERAKALSHSDGRVCNM